MAVNEDVSAYSNAAASNTPAGGDTVGPDLDNHLRDMKKNIRQVAENFITVSDENFKGRIKSTTSGSTHTLSYFADSGSVPIVAIDDSASTVTSYVDDVLMGAVGKDLAKQTTTASAQTALDLTVGTVGGQLLAETATASARSRLDLGTAAIENVGTSISDVVELVTGSATSAASLPAVFGDKLLGLQQSLPATPDFVTAGQTVTADTVLNVAHGLGAVPTLWLATLRCGTGEHGYTAGDEISSDAITPGNDEGVTINADATNITMTQGVGPFKAISQSTLNGVALTNGSWKWKVRVWT